MTVTIDDIIETLQETIDYYRGHDADKDDYVTQEVYRSQCEWLQALEDKPTTEAFQKRIERVARTHIAYLDKCDDDNALAILNALKAFEHAKSELATLVDLEYPSFSAYVLATTVCQAARMKTWKDDDDE